MALRDPDLLGFNDPRDLGAGPEAPKRPAAKRRAKPAAATPPAAAPASEIPSPPAPEGPAAAEATVPRAGRGSVALGDEERFLLQFMAPKALRRRLEFAAFELSERVPRLSEHQTILAALIWQHADPRDPGRLRALGELLDAFAADPVADLRADGKIGGNVPVSLKRRIDGSVLRLRDTHDRASKRTLGSALIWRYVDADDADSLDALEQTLLAYDAVAHPKRAAAARAA